MLAHHFGAYFLMVGRLQLLNEVNKRHGARSQHLLSGVLAPGYTSASTTPLLLFVWRKSSKAKCGHPTNHADIAEVFFLTQGVLKLFSQGTGPLTESQGWQKIDRR